MEKTDKTTNPWLSYNRKQKRYNQRDYENEFTDILNDHLTRIKDTRSKNVDGFKALMSTKIHVFDKSGELLNYSSNYDNFNQLSIAQVLLDNLSMMQFSEMTPIQKTVLPLVMKDENIIACAETGSGKTVAFLLPIINKMIVRGPSDTSAHENSKHHILYY